MSDCNHDVIAWRDDDGRAHLWGCRKCRLKFVPMTQLEAEVNAEREACAKVCETKWSTLGQMEASTAFAAAIRARGDK